MPQSQWVTQVVNYYQKNYQIDLTECSPILMFQSAAFYVYTTKIMDRIKRLAKLQLQRENTNKPAAAPIKTDNRPIEEIMMEDFSKK